MHHVRQHFGGISPYIPLTYNVGPSSCKLLVSWFLISSNYSHYSYSYHKYPSYCRLNPTSVCCGPHIVGLVIYNMFVLMLTIVNLYIPFIMHIHIYIYMYILYIINTVGLRLVPPSVHHGCTGPPDHRGQVTLAAPAESQTLGSIYIMHHMHTCILLMHILFIFIISIYIYIYI